MLQADSLPVPLPYSKLPATLVGISSDIEAAGNIIDILDATDEQPGVIMGQYRPAYTKMPKRWPNLHTIWIFLVQKTLVVITVDGRTLH